MFIQHLLCVSCCLGPWGFSRGTPLCSSAPPEMLFYQRRHTIEKPQKPTKTSQKDKSSGEKNTDFGEKVTWRGQCEVVRPGGRVTGGLSLRPRLTHLAVPTFILSLSVGVGGEHGGEGVGGGARPGGRGQGGRKAPGEREKPLGAVLIERWLFPCVLRRQRGFALNMSGDLFIKPLKKSLSDCDAAGSSS